jgi:hypothetical protein
MALVPGLGINDFGVEDTSEAGKLKCWLCTNDHRYACVRVKGNACVCASLVCPSSSNHGARLSKLVQAYTHGNEARVAIGAWFERRIDGLASAAEKQEIQALCFSYLMANRESGKALKIALNRLSRFKQKDRVAALMLAVWKNLAQSRASEQPIGVVVKDLRMALDICNSHRNDWDLYKREVYDAGQVHLVEKLVRPFAGTFSSFEL